MRQSPFEPCRLSEEFLSRIFSSIAQLLVLPLILISLGKLSQTCMFEHKCNNKVEIFSNSFLSSNFLMCSLATQQSVDLQNHKLFRRWMHLEVKLGSLQIVQ
ncbi:uncharacterized protein LOC126672689 [Mercurialis annua]|uniref:uncharacterized protein LOC126672689 n=1 Tax=Mercurialis annua TaxID=3986 RepID=UPI0021606087|nr:uncharacterized protein LOC126672689 [Mercurialis annua]